jgi:hypothetical protein
MGKMLNILFTLILLSYSSYSQRVKLVDMINISKCKEYSCFNDFVITKGFCFEEIANERPDITLYRFSSCNFISDGPQGINTKDQASYGLITTGSIMADIGTASNNYYRLLLSELKGLGFISYSTDNSSTNSVRVQYTSVRYPNINMVL